MVRVRAASWSGSKSGDADRFRRERAGVAEAAARLGVTPRTLYRFIDEGSLAAYKFGRVIRLKEADVERFIESARIEPGTLEHLYPESKSHS